jgi:type IV secretion system protein VirB5
MNPFRRPAERYGASAPLETPFHRAAQEWDRRIGEPVVQARNWRMMG